MSAEELYHEAILAHDESPRNEGRLETPTHSARVSNPLCGDRVQLDLEVVGDRIEDVRFVGRGCAISRASASMLTELVKGRSPEEALALGALLEHWLAGEGERPPELVGLEPLGAVRAFPSRIRCATLAWDSLIKALGPR